jgi:hypothetical protein
MTGLFLTCVVTQVKPLQGLFLYSACRSEKRHSRVYHTRLTAPSTFLTFLMLSSSRNLSNLFQSVTLLRFFLRRFPLSRCGKRLSNLSSPYGVGFLAESRRFLRNSSPTLRVLTLAKVRCPQCKHQWARSFLELFLLQGFNQSRAERGSPFNPPMSLAVVEPSVCRSLLFGVYNPQKSEAPRGSLAPLEVLHLEASLQLR